MKKLLLPYEKKENDNWLLGILEGKIEIIPVGEPEGKVRFKNLRIPIDASISQKLKVFYKNSNIANVTYSLSERYFYNHSGLETFQEISVHVTLIEVPNNLEKEKIIKTIKKSILYYYSFPFTLPQFFNYDFLIRDSIRSL